MQKRTLSHIFKYTSKQELEEQSLQGKMLKVKSIAILKAQPYSSCFVHFVLLKLITTLQSLKTAPARELSILSFRFTGKYGVDAADEIGC